MRKLLIAQSMLAITALILPSLATADTIPPAVTRVACDTFDVSGWKIFAYQEYPTTVVDPVCNAQDFFPSLLWREQENGASFSTAVLGTVAEGDDGTTWMCESTPSARYTLTGICTEDDQVSKTIVYAVQNSQAPVSDLTHSMINFVSDVGTLDELSTAIKDIDELLKIGSEFASINFTWKGNTYSLNNEILTQLRSLESIVDMLSTDKSTEEQVYIKLLSNKLYVEGWETVNDLKAAMLDANQVIAQSVSSIATRVVGYEMYVGQQQAQYEMYQTNRDMGNMPSNDEYCTGLAGTVSQITQTNDCDSAVVTSIVSLNSFRGSESLYGITSDDSDLQCASYQSMKCALENN